MDLKSQLKAWADSHGIVPPAPRGPVVWRADVGTFHNKQSIRTLVGTDERISDVMRRTGEMRGSITSRTLTKAELFAVRNRR